MNFPEADWNPEARESSFWMELAAVCLAPLGPHPAPHTGALCPQLATAWSALTPTALLEDRHSEERGLVEEV